MVTAVGGRNLVSRDENGLSDPFLVITLFDLKVKTQIIRKTLNPEWNETFTLPLAGVTEQTMVQFVVMDWDRFSSDDYMGEVSISYKEIAAQAAQNKASWFSLISTTGEVVSGDISLKFLLQDAPKET